MYKYLKTIFFFESDLYNSTYSGIIVKGSGNSHDAFCTVSAWELGNVNFEMNKFQES